MFLLKNITDQTITINGIPIAPNEVISGINIPVSTIREFVNNKQLVVISKIQNKRVAYVSTHDNDGFIYYFNFVFQS